MINKETANILSFLDGYVQPGSEEVSMRIAGDFKKRRIEKNMTRNDIAGLSGVPVSSVARFEQKGLISLKSLIALADALGYLAEIRDLFSEPKYSTMQELQQIRSNTGKKKAYHSTRTDNDSNR